MNKTQIRRAVQNKVDEKLRKAIDDVAESEARHKVYDAMTPAPKFPEDRPSGVQEAEPNKSRVFAPNDPRLHGG